MYKNVRTLIHWLCLFCHECPCSLKHRVFLSYLCLPGDDLEMIFHTSKTITKLCLCFWHRIMDDARRIGNVQLTVSTISHHWNTIHTLSTNIDLKLYFRRLDILQNMEPVNCSQQTMMEMRKYLKKSSSYWPSEQCFFNLFQNMLSGLADDMSGLADDMSGLADDMSGLADDMSGLADDTDNNLRWGRCS
jgi:hypothetical protein